MRWPFGPHHLTLKPSKKTKNKKQKTKKPKKLKNKQKERKQRKKNKKNTKIPKKELFKYQSKFSFFFGGFPKFPFLTTWPEKRAPPKHYKNRGFSNPFCGKQFWVTKRPFLDKKAKSRNSSYHFFAFFFSYNNKKHKNQLKPLFL